MVFKSRKFCVWLVSLGVVLVVYLLYGWLSQTPRIDINRQTGSADTMPDFDSEKIGMIGEVGVSAVKRAKYIHLNIQKQVDREFGFEKLLAEGSNEWEIEKPYMNIFRRNLKCFITADKGKVQVEPAVGRPSPKDATFTDNVVIRILPDNDSDIQKSTIYLDDVTFTSEKTQFSTAGPVKLVSPNAQMLGRGLEFVYNDQAERLEFLRIIHLENLHIEASSQNSLFSSPQTVSPTNQQSTASIEHTTLRSSASLRSTSQAPGNYRCVLSKNVVIDTAERLIFADQIFINNIQSGKETKRQRHKGTEPQNTSRKPRATSHEPQVTDIVITCDGGVLVTPVDSQLRPDTVVTDSKISKNLDDANGRTTFTARRIDYDASTGNTVAVGPSELRFYVSDITGAAKTTAPVRITAQKKVEFLPASKQIIFEGDCVSTMLRAEPNSQNKYTLSAPKLTVDLSASGTDLEHITATGGVVRLATIKTSGEEPLGGIELKCVQFDYDTNQQMFIAAGPGVIKIDNSKIEPGGFSLQKPCYAFVRDFETLKYSLKTNQITADAGPQGTLNIDYIPVVNGEYGQQIFATAGHIEALFHETTDSRTELSTLKATGGVTYKDQDKQFEGSEFYYDANDAVINIYGQPCYFNGSAFGHIEYDLKTNEVKTRIKGPGLLQMKQ